MRDIKAAVVLDAWKLPYFKRELDGANFEYTQLATTVPGTITLQVEFELFRIDALNRAIQTAQANAAAGKHMNRSVH